MKVLILAAGYATRLYPLTLNQPKPLLPVAGKPMLEHILDHLAPSRERPRRCRDQPEVRGAFQEWSDKYRATKTEFDFNIVNDHRPATPTSSAPSATSIS